MEREIFSIIILCLIPISLQINSLIPSPSLSNIPEHSNRRAVINYRKIEGVRYGEPYSPLPHSSQTELTTKTEKQELPSHNSKFQKNIVQPAQSFQQSNAENILVEEDIENEKKGGRKSSRRRKVKRPIKIKSSSNTKVPPIQLEDLGSPESSNKTNDKNLALEIGTDDGKYALIDKFFNDTDHGLNAPGIVSYLKSNDFEKDNEKTLGNVNENDIWLSEGHLLVLKGGDFDSASQDKWDPIDNYERDKSKPPLKIPLDTNNPPPFPVFLNSSGPPVFLGPEPPFPYPPLGFGDENFDPSRHPPPGLIPLFPNGSIPEFPPNGPFGPPGRPGGLYGNDKNFTNGLPPPPFYPFPPPGKNSRLPPLPPLFPPGPPPGFNNSKDGPFPFLPPLVLNPNDNETDDPSIFLPPPYDFDYYEDNSTIVPPGPFAPGLVVPPPRDFYTVYNRTSPSSLPFTPTTIGYGEIYRGKQRENGKRPRFPLTNPPDDSIEANLPQTTPLITIEFPSKKRKERPSKFAKSYPTDARGSVNQSPIGIINEDDRRLVINNPSYEAIKQLLTTTPIPISLPIKSKNIILSTKAPTIKPLNYVYVRGKLKTLAEIAAEKAIENGFKPLASTEIPPFNELGYPNRDKNEPEQQFFLNYEAPSKNPKKTLKPTHSNNNIYTNQNHNQYIQEVIPTRGQKKQEPIYFQQNNNYGGNQEYYTQQQKSPQLTSYEQPQQQGFIQHNTLTGNSNLGLSPVTSSIFTPSFIPSLPPPQRAPRVIFPQGKYRNNERSPHGTYEPKGYYSPISHYSTHNNNNDNQHQHQQEIYSPPIRQSIQQNTNNNGQIYNSNNNNQSPHHQQVYDNRNQFSQNHQLDYHNRGNVPQFVPNNYFNGGNRGSYTTQFYHPSAAPYFSPYQQQAQNLNPYVLSQQQQQQQQQGEGNVAQTVPLHQDILINYREPLPSYNSESERISTRSVLLSKAGPRTSPIYGTQEPAQEQQGSFYSFQRGGPGGFSYNIRL